MRGGLPLFRIRTLMRTNYVDADKLTSFSKTAFHAGWTESEKTLSGRDLAEVFVSSHMTNDLDKLKVCFFLDFYKIFIQYSINSSIFYYFTFLYSFQECLLDQSLASQDTFPGEDKRLHTLEMRYDTYDAALGFFVLVKDKFGNGTIYIYNL